MVNLKSKTVSFDDVLLAPQYSDIASRSEIEISQSLRGVGNFSLPVISSPMDTITGEECPQRCIGLGVLG